MKRRPLGFHQGLDLFELMLQKKALFYTLPMWLPVYLMAYIYWHVVLVSLREMFWTWSMRRNSQKMLKMLRRLRDA